MKNICFFSGDITLFGGTERSACAISTELEKQLSDKYNIRFLSVCFENEQTHFELDKRIIRTALRKKPIKSYFSYIPLSIKLLKYLRREKIDILIDVDSVLDIVFMLIKPFCKTKLVSWDHFSFDEALGTVYRKRLRGFTAPKTDAIVTLTAGDRKKYIDSYRLKCPVVTIHNPMPRMDCTGYDGNSKTILSVGALVQVKGFDMLCNIAKTVLDRHPDWQWLVVGQGELEKSLLQQIHELGLENKVRLCGYADSLDEYYNRSAVYALTSRSEGLPMVLLEAKTHSLPIITFDIGSVVSELLRPNENALVAAAFDIDEYAEKLCRLIEDEQLRRSLSRNAKLDSESFEFDFIIKQWDELLSQL